ncbi:MAG: sigma-70 family RNA polymerase sigma factor [Planctomycetaceae bacterium]|nr:sigma-70 family RNA polymerase sigma factor [Planctomycetaceae bacterium]
MHHDINTPDTDAVITTLLSNHRRFLNFLEARVGSRHDAEEILQNAFVRSLQKASEIRDSENAVAWFYRLLRNAVVDYHRSNSANRRSLETFARQLSASDEHADPAVERVICECVGELVSVLNPEDADLITRVDLQGANVTSVADLLSITPGNARVRLHRARTALRHEVERTCRTCATHGCLDCTCNTKGTSCGTGK